MSTNLMEIQSKDPKYSFQSARKNQTKHLSIADTVIMEPPGRTPAPFLSIYSNFSVSKFSKHCKIKMMTLLYWESKRRKKVKEPWLPTISVLFLFFNFKKKREWIWMLTYSGRAAKELGAQLWSLKVFFKKNFKKNLNFIPN
jgi:hypothetical protein